MSCALWWVRRDLRLVDNQALNSALELVGQVVPVFILDERLLASSYMSEKRLAFLWCGLRELDRNLRCLGSYLVVRRGDPQAELRKLLQECQAQAIFAELDHTPYASARDQRIAEQLPVTWVGSPAAKPPGSVLKGNGAPFTVFTPFSKAWKALPGPQPGQRFSQPQQVASPVGIPSDPIPTLPELPEGFSFLPGEAEAQRRLADFLHTPIEEIDFHLPPVYHYAASRNQLDIPGTSQLSPYLRFGMLSARQAIAGAMQAIQDAPHLEARQSAETWLNELIWREFYIHMLYHYPSVRRENFRLPHVRWENDQANFQAWCEGRTGYPVVDAAMRQLLHSGWMHNRARMIVASFLTKDLLIDWRWGERWFMQQLVDGDPAANNGGWQWTAGTGTDAAPYFRIFNPVSQGLKHDPQGRYIRRWLPELRRVPDEYLHEPWKMPPDLQKAAGWFIGVDYPAPLVDHSQARERALLAYKQDRN
jgi:deoxyribodipyrimidine photo-lyase